MTKVIITIGLPASGKSTWAKAYVQNNKNSYRVNKDGIRNMTGIWRFGKKEKEVVSCQNKLLEYFLQSGAETIIVDNTHFRQSDVNKVVDIAEKYKAEVEYKFFDAGLKTCIERNKRRNNKIPQWVIEKMHTKALRQGFVFKDYPVDTYVPNTSFPKAIICDVDGTLAHMVNRGPYDREKVSEDISDEHIVELINLYYNKGYKIIVVSARDGVCYDDTKIWLDSHDVPYQKLVLRESGDTRSDNIVKKEMLDEISKEYNIHLAIDDRDSIISLWRGLGIKTLQVGYGNF